MLQNVQTFGDIEHFRPIKLMIRAAHKQLLVLISPLSAAILQSEY